MAIKAYLICPVRNANPKQIRKMTEYVENLERKGFEFHFPHRDVNQFNDDGGVRICIEHVLAMSECEEIHVWMEQTYSPYDKGYNYTLSEGSLFDLGMAFMLSHLDDTLGMEVKFVLAHGELPGRPEKSFLNLLKSLVDDTKKAKQPASVLHEPPE